jgi:1,4-dihydroxy-2-naphthoate polyprenyltransferase
LGNGLAYSIQGHFSWLLFLFTLLCALSIQIATNLINDGIDVKKGTDKETRLGPIRPIHKGAITIEETMRGGYISLLLACLFGIPLVWQGGMALFLLLIVSVACAYLYTGGPYPLGYLGLGELFIFLFFGLASTGASYYLQTGRLDSMAFLAGSQLGLLAMIPMAIDNLRDIVDDGAANKRTLAVRFGKKFARHEITWLIFTPYLLNVLWWIYGFTFAVLLPWITAPFAYKLIKNIRAHEPDRIYNQFLAQSAKLNLLFASLLVVGFLLK